MSGRNELTAQSELRYVNEFRSRIDVSKMNEPSRWIELLNPSELPIPIELGVGNELNRRI